MYPEVHANECTPHERTCVHDRALDPAAGRVHRPALSLPGHPLVTRGATVWHIMSRGRLERHRLTPFARVDGIRIIYDGTGSELPLLAPS